MNVNREKWCTRAQAAARAGVSLRTIDRWTEAGDLTKYNVGGRQWVRYATAEIDAMITPREPVSDGSEQQQEVPTTSGQG